MPIANDDEMTPEDTPAVIPRMSADDAALLRDRGQISPDTYQRMYPVAAVTDKAPPVPKPLPPPDEISQAVQMASARRADEEAARAQAEREDADAHLRDLKRILSFKIQGDVRRGMSEEDVRKKYADQQDEIRGLEAPAAPAPAKGDIKPAMADMPNAGGAPASTAAPAGVLASDGVSGGMAPAKAMSPADAAGAAVSAYGLDRGLNLEAAAIQEASKVGQAKAAEQSAYLDRSVADNEKRVRSSEAAEAERQRQLASKASELEAATQDLAAQKIDPKHYWADKSTGDKVVAGIGLFLGAIGAGQTDGVNMAVKTMEKAIDKDIETQKANFEIKKDAVNAKAGLYAKMHERFRDTKAAEDATRIAYLDNAKMQIEAIGARHASAEVKAKSALLVSQIEQKKDALKASFIGQMSKHVPVDETTDPETLDKDKRERFVPGYGLALSDKNADLMKAAVGETKASKDALNSLLTIANTPGAATDPAMRARAESEAAMLQGLLRTQVLGPGTVNDSERTMLEGLIANPTKILSLDSNNKVRLQTLVQRLDKNLAAKASGYGLKSRQEKIGFTVGAK